MPHQFSSSVFQLLILSEFRMTGHQKLIYKQVGPGTFSVIFRSTLLSSTFLDRTGWFCHREQHTVENEALLLSRDLSHVITQI